MSFNLNEFKSRVIAPQRSNKFEVTITRTGGDAEDFRDVKLLAEDVQFPTFEFASLYSVPRYGFGIQDVFPAGPKFKELVITFIMEQGGGIYETFRKWINDITPINYIPNEGSTTHKYYTLNYKDDYQGTIEVKLLAEADRGQPGTWSFAHAWPVSIMGEPFSWQAADEYTSFAVTFIYYNMAFDPGERPVEGVFAEKYRHAVPTIQPGTPTINTPPIPDPAEGS